jgi:hypothetical protein
MLASAVARTNRDLFHGVFRLSDAMPGSARSRFAQSLRESGNLDFQNEAVLWQQSVPGNNNLLQFPLPSIRLDSLRVNHKPNSVFDHLNHLFHTLKSSGDCSDLMISYPPDKTRRFD